MRLLPIAKFLVRHSASLVVQKSLGPIFDEVDRRLPMTIHGQTAGQIASTMAEEIIVSAIADATGLPVKQQDVEVIRFLYDPIIAAGKNRRP